MAREESFFDELARGLADGTLTRGKALRLMGAALVGGTLGSLGIGEAGADPPGCKRIGKHCTRGCYELWLGNGSILAWLLENHTQVTFPTKSGRSLPLIWRSFEKTLHSAPTNCARSSTG
jgi:hypothetical protein